MEIIGTYEYELLGDLNHCKSHGILYQNDMSGSVEYDRDYFDKYISYMSTEISYKINQGRVNLIIDYIDSQQSILDIGVGSLEFINFLNAHKVYGYDINPVAVDILTKKNIYLDPYKDNLNIIHGVSFWDSLEHIKDPYKLLSRFKEGTFVFISLPIIEEKDINSIRQNKHYKPNEHYYYFTDKGIKTYMNDCKYRFIEERDFEIQAGRENIYSYVFVKE